MRETWRKLIVEELRFLEQLNIIRVKEVIKVYHYSIDDLDTKVNRFIAKHDLTSRVCILSIVNNH
jgi:hypothetical protein